jgi:ribosomal protein S18 acetylase RimI-like enzyme
VLYEVDQASFAEDWGFRPTSFESFNEELRGEDWDPSLVFLAEAGEETVGHVVSFLFETRGHVGILGVLKEWRRRGIGRSLLRRSFAELAGRGMPEVRLGVDAQNVHGAVALYEGVGMSVHRRYDTVLRVSAYHAAASRYIFPMMLLTPSASKARIVSERMFPAEASFARNATPVSSSGNSEIATMSYWPIVQ